MHTVRFICFRTDLDPPTEVKNKLYHVLDQWAKGKVRKVWMSESLPQHFNLPVMTSPPDCWLFQALCLGQDLEFVLLTLYSGTSVAREPDTAQIRNFSMKCARMLTSSLLNVYHRDFILLPCTVHYKNSFDAETLQKEVEEQLDYAADFYGGPEKLRGIAFDEMVRAMSMVASSTSVPSLLFDQDRKGKVMSLHSHVLSLRERANARESGRARESVCVCMCERLHACLHASVTLPA